MTIKVCGLRAPENIAAVLATAAPDIVGFVFHPASPRAVDVGGPLSAWIEANSNTFGQTQKAGVFVNASIEDILNNVHDYELDYVQLHGEESPEYCREIASYWRISTIRQAKLVKAFSIDADFDFEQTERFAVLCPLFVFDTKTAERGGSGKRFDWRLLEQYKGKTPFLLSGGIGPADVESVLALRHPRMVGVDINSRFETAPGVKDAAEVARFCEAVRAGSGVM